MPRAWEHGPNYLSKSGNQHSTGRLQHRSMTAAPRPRAPAYSTMSSTAPQLDELPANLHNPGLTSMTPDLTRITLIRHTFDLQLRLRLGQRVSCSMKRSTSKPEPVENAGWNKRKLQMHMHNTFEDKKKKKNTYYISLYKKRVFYAEILQHLCNCAYM